MINLEATACTLALGDWRTLLGDEHVSTVPGDLNAAGTATFATTARVLGILRPADRQQVQEIVRIANRHGIPIYPISTGRNWGYGSRVPPRDGVLLDLGRMNRIVDFDERLAYVTIEPGVTQRQLHRFLTDRGARLWMDATGASPDCSVIGNTLERGFGHTPLGDHCANSCGYEVVLANGDCIETGFGRFAGARSTPVSRWGVGPSLDGLFSQSNFGIVTRMTVWLMPAPERFQAFFFMTRDADRLGPIVDALRSLRLNGTLRSVMHIGNDYKVLNGNGQFPWPEPAPLDAARMERIRRSLGIGAWNGSGGLYGTPNQVREARRIVKAALAGRVDRLQFVDGRLLAFMRRFAGPIGLVSRWDLRRVLKVLLPVYGLMQGVPTDATMASAYWRKKTPPPTDPDPDRDGCGLLWCSPVVPNVGDEVLKVTRLATAIVADHGFEPQMSLSMASERMSICVITISYDRAVEGEDARALACYRVLLDRLIAAGYPPYRLSVASMDGLGGAPTYSRALAALRSALDRQGILAPGRYEPQA